MAKQSFTVGQVLTAAQMTSLQSTAMLGGSATAKTANYVLVAADAGTVVSVNSTSATTITVNTGLFSAGDTVTIQNWGSGAVTITAGTATVNTAGSLIVPQYDGGVLYFTSASAAIYFDFVQAGAVSPLTTKGDLYTFSTSDARLGVGANNTVLTADSAEATGLKWAAVSGGAGNLTEIATGSLSGASVVISSLSTYSELLLICYGQTNSTGNGQFGVRINSNSGSTNYRNTGFKCENNTQQMQNAELSYCAGSWDTLDRTNASNAFAFKFTNTKTTGFTDFDVVGSGIISGYNISLINKGIYKVSEAVSSLQILNNGGNFSAGTYILWGA